MNWSQLQRPFNDSEGKVPRIVMARRYEAGHGLGIGRNYTYSIRGHLLLKAARTKELQLDICQLCHLPHSISLE